MIVKNNSPIKKAKNSYKNAKTQSSINMPNRQSSTRLLQCSTLPIRQTSKKKEELTTEEIEQQNTTDDFSLPINSLYKLSNTSNCITDEQNRLHTLSLLVKKLNKARLGVKEPQRKYKTSENIIDSQIKTQPTVFKKIANFHKQQLNVTSEIMLRDIITQLKIENNQLKKQISKYRLNEVKKQALRTNQQENDLGKFLYLLYERQQQIQDLKKKIRIIQSGEKRSEKTNLKSKIGNNRGNRSLGKIPLSLQISPSSAPQYLKQMKNFYKKELQQAQQRYSLLQQRYHNLQKKLQLLEIVIRQKDEQLKMLYQDKKKSQALTKNNKQIIKQNQTLANKISIINAQLNHSLQKLTKLQQEHCHMSIKYHQIDVQNLIMKDKLAYYEENSDNTVINIKSQYHQKQKNYQYIQQMKQSLKLQQIQKIKEEQYREIDQLQRIFEINQQENISRT